MSLAVSLAPADCEITSMRFTGAITVSMAIPVAASDPMAPSRF